MNDENIQQSVSEPLRLSVPLLGMKSLLSDSLQMLMERFWKLVLLQLFSALPILVLIGVFVAYAGMQVGFSLFFGQSMPALLGSLLTSLNVVLGIIGILAFVGMFVFWIWGRIATLLYLKEGPAEGSILPFIRDARPLIGGMIGIEIIRIIFIVIGFICLVVPGIYLYVRYLFVPFAYVFEHKSGVRGGLAFKRGFGIIDGYRWGVYARLLVFGLLVFAVGASLQAVFGMFNILLSLIKTPYAAAVLISVSLLFGLAQIVLNMGLQLFRTVFGFQLFQNTYRIKQQHPSERLHHPFAWWKKTFLVAALCIAMLIPAAALFMVAWYNVVNNSTLLQPLLESSVLESRSSSADDNPRYADPDGDGVPSNVELFYRTDPLRTDTDSDGLTDRQEIESLGLNPLDPDTDQDGTPDNEEINRMIDDSMRAE